MSAYPGKIVADPRSHIGEALLVAIPLSVTLWLAVAGLALAI